MQQKLGIFYKIFAFLGTFYVSAKFLHASSRANAVNITFC